MTLSKKFKASGLLSTGDVARELDVHRSTVWLWIKSGLLKKSKSKVGGFIGVKLIRSWRKQEQKRGKSQGKRKQ